MKQQDIIDNIKGFYYEITDDGISFSETYNGYSYEIEYNSWNGSFEIAICSELNESELDILTSTIIEVSDFIIETYNEKTKSILDIIDTNESLLGY
tara:strand:- start:1398 stop:1685 length:288 start_codon:yes stop_codon:yes gene_type:complete